ncbi:hypothetical protein YC2023_054802 [Brassica napus]
MEKNKCANNTIKMIYFHFIRLSRYGFDPARYRPPMHHLWLIRVAVSFEILRLRALPLPLEFSFLTNSNNLLSRKNRSRSSIFPAK